MWVITHYTYQVWSKNAEWTGDESQALLFPDMKAATTAAKEIVAKTGDLCDVTHLRQHFEKHDKPHRKERKRERREYLNAPIIHLPFRRTMKATGDGGNIGYEKLETLFMVVKGRSVEGYICEAEGHISFQDMDDLCDEYTFEPDGTQLIKEFMKPGDN